MAVKVPPLLHKMSVSSQKAWYKKNNMDLPPHLTSAEGRSAAQAKKDVGEINKKKAREAAIAQAAASKKNKELVKSSERVRQMAANVKAFGGMRPGGDLTTVSGIKQWISSGGTIRAGRLGEAADRTSLIGKIAKDIQNKKTSKEIVKRLGASAGKYALNPNKDLKLKPSSPVKVDMSARQDRQISYQYEEVDQIQEANPENKAKKKEAIRQIGLKAMKAGKVDPARGHIPQRAGREILRGAAATRMVRRAMEKEMSRMGMGEENESKTKPSNYPGQKLQRDYLDRYRRTPKEDWKTKQDREYGLATDDKAGRWAYGGKYEEVEMTEASKAEAEKILGGPVKTKPKNAPAGKLPYGFRRARNLARQAMKAGKAVNETGEYTEIGHAPEHAAYLDVDPTSSDPLKLQQKHKKPAQYKKGMRNGVQKESIEDLKMNKGKILAKAIMAKQSKHPIAQNMGEAVKDQADVGEYDYEGDMAKSQLRSILANAQRLHDMLEDQTNLPEWVQSKITLAEDYVLTAANYMEGEMNEEVEQIDEGDLSIRTLYNKWADHYTSSEGNSAKRADAVEKTITKVHGPAVMNHLKKAIKANLRNDMDQEENHFERARNAAEKSGSDRINATVGRDRSKFRKEEVEQTDEAIRVTMANRQLPPKSKRRVAGGAPTKSDMRRDVAAAAAKEKRSMYGHKGLPMGGINALNVLMPKKMPKGQETWFVGAKKTNEEVEQVTEAEGTVAVTPKEKELAAHHGDPKKITYGDVIKARLKSAAAKKMGK